MGRRIRNAHLETRSARSKLTPRGNPYWQGLEAGLHLGYRRLKGIGGKWIVRFYQGRYEQRVIAEADDYSDANGHTVLTYDQAQAKARDLMKRRTFAEAGVHTGPYTVANAIDDYVAFLKTSGKDHKGAERRAHALILPELGDIETAKLTSARLRQWHSDLAEQGARLRTANGKPQNYRKASTEEAQRARKVSANRTMSILKSALNHAYDERRIESNDAWSRRVKPFRNVKQARLRYLTIPEAQRLINACGPDFRPLVQAALQTGCRFGELIRLTASDFNADTGTVLIARSKSGQARHVILTDEGATFFSRLCVGRAGGEQLFDGWYKTAQQRAMREALGNAKISPPITFHGLRHTWASHAVMNGTPLMVVARNLGHVDTRMVEAHYGHLSPSFVADAVRAGAPRFGVVSDSNVREITRGRR